MHNKLLVALSLIVGRAMAMESEELTISSEQSLPTSTAEKMATIQLQGGETRELPSRYIFLSGTLKNLVGDLTEAHKEAIALPQVSLATWQLIDNLLELVYKSTQGDTGCLQIMRLSLNQLDSRSLIDLSWATDYLDIPLLKKTIVELAQTKLTLDEILFTTDEMLELPAYIRNEHIKRKVIKIAGPAMLKELAVCRGHEGWVNSVCVTQDNKIVSGASDGTVRIWDMAGNELAVCLGHVGEVWSVCVTQDSKIVSGSNDGTVRVWNMNGNELAVCRGHVGQVWSVCVTQDNKIVSSSWDKTVRIWDMEGKQLAVCGGHEAISKICVTKDNKIVSGSWYKTVRVWDMNGQELAICRGHEGGVISVCITHDNRIVSGSMDRTVRIWDTAGKQLAVCKDHRKSVSLVCVTQDNKIVSGSDWDVRIWDIDGNQLAVCWGHKGKVSSVCVTLDNRIVSGSKDKKVRVWDINGNQLAVCRGHKAMVKSVLVTQDNRIVSGSSGSKDNTVRIWDMSDIILDERLSGMNKKQAQAICKILPSAACENREQKEQTWKEISNILNEELANESN